MYHIESNTPALARTSNLNEELGQVKQCLIENVARHYFFPLAVKHVLFAAPSSRSSAVLVLL